MSRYRVTSNSIAVEWSDYRRGNASGPAVTYYRRSDLERASAHYGWGDAGKNPLSLVEHMGDKVPIVEVLIGSMEPYRVKYY